MKTAGHRGELTKTISVRTDDPQSASTVLSIHATIEGSVLLLPTPAISLSTFRAGPRGGKILVRQDPTENGTLALSDVKVSLPWLTVKSRKVVSAGEREEGLPEAQPGDWVLELDPSGEPEPGNYQASVVFKTGLPREPEVTVPAYVSVRGVFTVSPREAVVTPPAETVVLVAVRPDTDPDSVRVTAKPEGVHAELEKTSARAFRLHVSWKGEGAPPASGEVTVASGEKTETIPVRFSRTGS